MSRNCLSSFLTHGSIFLLFFLKSLIIEQIVNLSHEEINNKRGDRRDVQVSGSHGVKYFEINTASTLKRFYQKREFVAIIPKKKHIYCINDN